MKKELEGLGGRTCKQRFTWFKASADGFLCVLHVGFTMLDLAWPVLSGDGAEGTGLDTCGRTHIYIYTHTYIYISMYIDILMRIYIYI